MYLSYVRPVDLKHNYLKKNNLYNIINSRWDSIFFIKSSPCIQSCNYTSSFLSMLQSTGILHVLHRDMCYFKKIKSEVIKYYTMSTHRSVTSSTLLQHNFCVRFLLLAVTTKIFIDNNLPGCRIPKAGMLWYWEILFYIVYDIWIRIVFRPKGVLYVWCNW